MKYQNRQTGVVAELISKDEEKTRMVILQGPDKPISCTISTFKRWWKKVDEEVDDVYVAEVMEQKKELGIECPPIESYEVVDEDTCADGRKYSEIGKEIAEQAKQKAKNAKAKKSSSISYEERLSKVTDVLSAKGYTVKVQDKQPSTLNIKSAGESKATYGIYLGSRKAVLLMPVTKVPKGATPDRVRNCPLGAAFDISYDNLKKINELI